MKKLLTAIFIILSPSCMNVQESKAYRTGMYSFEMIDYDFVKQSSLAVCIKDYYTSSMHYKIFTGTSSTYNGGLSVHTVNITQDSLLCEYYRKQLMH